MASVIIDVIHDNVATKSDLRLTETTLKSEMGSLKQDLTMRGIAGLGATASILFAALQYWPPAGHG